MSRGQISGRELLELERVATMETGRDCWVMLRVGRPRVVVRAVRLAGSVVVATVATADDRRVEGPVATGAGATSADTLQQILELRSTPEACAAGASVAERLRPEDRLWLRAGPRTPKEAARDT